MNPYAMCNMYNNMSNSYPCGCIRLNNNQFNNNYPAKNFPYEWSRVGPMGGLMEPKLIYVPPNPAADIEVETNIRTKISQRPNGFTNMQFPMPPPDLLRRINDQRLRTTYQSDFCNVDNYPMITEYSSWVYNSNNKARLANMQKKNSEEIDCGRPQPKPPYLGGHEIPGRKRKDLISFSPPVKESNGRKRSSQISSRLSRASREQKQKNGRLESSPKAKVDKQLESRSNKKNNDEAEVEVASSNLEDKETGSLKSNSSDLEENFNNEEENNKESDDKRDHVEEPEGQKNENEDNNNSSSSYNSADSCESTKKNVNDDTYVYLNYSNRRRKYTVDPNNENFHLDTLPWLSEYENTIGATGDEILKTKLHYYGKLRLLPDYIAHKKKQADMKKDKDKKNKAKS